MKPDSGLDQWRFLDTLPGQPHTKCITAAQAAGDENMNDCGQDLLNNFTAVVLSVKAVGSDLMQPVLSGERQVWEQRSELQNWRRLETSATTCLQKDVKGWRDQAKGIHF